MVYISNLALTAFLLLVSNLAVATEAEKNNALLQSLRECITSQQKSDESHGNAARHCKPFDDLRHDSSHLPAHLSTVQTTDTLQLEQLLDLEYFLLQRTASNPRFNPDHIHLRSIISDIYVDETKTDEAGWFERFIQWLKLKLGDSDEQDLRWLENLLNSISISESLVKSIYYACMGMIILLAIIIVIQILRNAGISLPTSGLKKTDTNSLDDEYQPNFSISEIRKLPLQSQPAALFAHCVLHMMQSGHVPHNQGMTNSQLASELANISANTSSTVNQAFRRLMRASEDSFYGTAELSEGEVKACFTDAGMLLGTHSVNDSH